MNRERLAPASLDREHPFAGLQAFGESDKDYFYGRDIETQLIFRLVHRESLTVLFGGSGLGKTSLLHAGLFPLLREALLWPVPIRLDFTPGRSLADFVKHKLREVLLEHDIDGPMPSHETFWEYFHCARWWNSRNRLLTPVLVFDQFEEIFTLGRDNETVTPFLTELADLVENRIPAGVRRRLEFNEEGLPFSYARQNLRTVLVLREDYLPQLEDLRGRIPTISRSRFRLKQMNGNQGIVSILKPAGHLVAPEVAREILFFIADIPKDVPSVDLARIEVEPSLLSLFCRELNERRINNNSQKITTDLVKVARGEILADFYNKSLSDQSSGMRAYIEEQLLTGSGFRQSEPIEDAMKVAGVREEALATLVNRRILRREERWGRTHVELIHDVLAPIVLKSREQRREREKRRHRIRQFILACVVALLLFLGVGVAAFREWRLKKDAEATRAQAEEVINYILFDLHDQLGQLGRLDVLEGAQDIALKYYDSLPSEGESTISARNRAKTFINVGDVYFQQGRTDKALKLYRHALDVAERAGADDPESREIKAATASAYEGIGRVARQGNSRRALESYEKSLRIFQRLCGLEPAHEEWCLKYGVLYERIAYALGLQGDMDGALMNYRLGLRVKQQVATAHPNSVRTQESLARSLFGIAEVLYEKGDLEGAIDSHQKSLRIRVRLAARDPKNAGLQEWLAVGFLSLGNVLLEKGDVESAVRQFLEGLRVNERLVAQDPTNATWLRNLAALHESMGIALVHMKRFKRALDENLEALRIRRQLYEKDPGNLDAVNALSWCHYLIGLAHKAAGDQESARQEWQRSVDMIASLVTETDQRRLLDTYARGLLLLGRLEEARPIVERLRATGWRDPGFEEALRESGYSRRFIRSHQGR